MRILITAILFLSITALIGQKNVDIRLNHSSTKGNVNCFDVELRSPQGHNIKVAGQNYRLFYDANKLSFLEDAITHNLDKRTYGRMDLLSTIDNNIGFISLSFEGRILSDKIIELNRKGNWEKTMNLCFSKEFGSHYDITWANPRRTSQFATAEVALSEWIDKENQQILLPNEVYDFSSTDQLTEKDDALIMRVFPNPVVDQIHLSFEYAQPEYDVIIKDVIGREVVNDHVSQETSVNYDLAGWPEGAYTIVVFDESGDRLLSETIIKINP